MRIVRLNTKSVYRFKVKSDTKIIIEKNSILSLDADQESNYIDSLGKNEGEKNISSALSSENCENIEIVGERDSVLNGSATSLINERAKGIVGIVLFVNCKNIRIKDLTLINSLHWAIKFENCENVEIDNVRIVSKWGLSNSGIEILSSRNVSIKNCVLDVGDSCIALRTLYNKPCEKIVVENCVFSSVWNSFRVGTDSYGDFNNIVLRKCTVNNSGGGFLKIAPIDGGSVNNLLVEDIDIYHSTGPIFIANGNRNKYQVNDENLFSSISNVTLRNIRADVYIDYASYSEGKGDYFLITGNDKRRINNIIIEDCVFNMPGGKSENIEFGLHELTTQYPEYYVLGIAPASGIFIRHSDNVIVRNVQINLKETDCREKIVLDDVVNFLN